MLRIRIITKARKAACHERFFRNATRRRGARSRGGTVWAAWAPSRASRTSPSRRNVRRCGTRAQQPRGHTSGALRAVLCSRSCRSRPHVQPQLYPLCPAQERRAPDCARAGPPGPWKRSRAPMAYGLHPRRRWLRQRFRRGNAACGGGGRSLSRAGPSGAGPRPRAPPGDRRLIRFLPSCTAPLTSRSAAFPRFGHDWPRCPSRRGSHSPRGLASPTPWPRSLFMPGCGPA